MTPRLPELRLRRRIARIARFAQITTLVVGPVVGLVSGCSGRDSGGASAASLPGLPIGAGADCAASATCSTSRSLGSLSGDSDGGPLHATGSTSAWLSVQTTEDTSAWSGRALHLRATLTPPAGGSYELVAYANLAERDADGGTLSDAARGLDCARVVGKSRPAGDREVLDLEWGEPSDGSANGLDDGRVVAIEVRHVGGTCGQWSLDVQGN